MVKSPRRQITGPGTFFLESGNWWRGKNVKSEEYAMSYGRRTLAE